MYLVFADKDIVRGIELVECALPMIDSEPDYGEADWKEIDTHILLGEYEENTAKEAIKKAAKEFETDVELLFAIKLDDNYSRTYIHDEEGEY